MIHFEDVSKTYGDFHAVNSINLEIKKGEIVALIGPSGSGKTTTLKMINRLIEQSQGTISINGQNIFTQNPIELRRNIGYVIQHVGLLPHMTIADNIAIVPKLKKWEKTVYLQRVDELLAMVGLDPEIYRNRYPAELSGGQQQRIGVIRALAADPPIILMDEPFSALDPISREQLQDEVIRLQQKLKKTIVFVTHDIDEAIKIADRICIMRNGQIVQLGTPEQILRHPANDFVREFIGEQRMGKLETLPDLKDILIKPITARPNRGLAEGINAMRKHKVDSLVIVDQNEKLMGIVGVWEIQNHFDEEHLLLEDIMRRDFPVLSNTNTLSDAIYLISKHRVAYLPVVNADRELLGLITRASLVDVMANQFGTSQQRNGGVSTAC
ncbi:Choline transport ATP-binding protein OpuBA [bioreactor metagenome]|uniref:Choline transport ATP-binding protein OpuBA n=1 Tax=bioreactor metagenome TaxID=1076179 RepID=A0A644TR21_9ZZZZ|nr:betaine/proline/choline family ABC transporter ATP-binding protein [Negativicutes bacterium]